ncbi:MAG: peptidyl-tRNA hydrolase Pth2 [Candidatus Marsarchaeota archaeon]|jgi:PTH2 family peptidyl-tRNA hydrolase|nr:peptidyl-tRNA hydrolase Pth2 [Candidatus Marsarchaeota archaeon]
MELKQVIVIRSDIEMGKGKMAAQAAHAALMSYLESQKIDKKISDKWIETGEKKIVLKGENLEMLKKLYEAFKYKGVPCALVSDAGLTELPPGTITALGIGPWSSEEIDKFTKTLKLL